MHTKPGLRHITSLTCGGSPPPSPLCIGTPCQVPLSAALAGRCAQDSLHIGDYGAGPRSRELLTSGVEGLAPGERLPSDAVKAPDGLSALMTRNSGRSQPDDRVPAELDSDEESPIETPREPEVTSVTESMQNTDDSGPQCESGGKQLVSLHGGFAEPHCTSYQHAPVSFLC